MKHQKYKRYRKSGIEWIPEIPSKWEVVPLRFLGNLYGGLTGKKGEDFGQENNEKNKLYIPYTNIYNNVFIDTVNLQNVLIEDGENQNKVKQFDLFFLMSSENFEDLGKNSILLEDFEELYLNSFCKGFRINSEKVFPKFLNYLFLGDLNRKLISIEGNGFTRINLRQEGLLKTPIILPSVIEQRAIVTFLESEVVRIKILIEKKLHFVKRLKEKRLAVISKAVTKGVNPNVEQPHTLMTEFPLLEVKMFIQMV